MWLICNSWIILQHGSDDDDTEKEGSISGDSDKAYEVEESKQGKKKKNEKNKANETKGFSKQQAATRLKEEGKGKGKKGKKVIFPNLIYVQWCQCDP